MKIVADQHIPFLQHYFSHHENLVLKPGRKITHADVQDTDVLLVRSVTPVNAILLADTSVKFVGSVTAGSDHLDIAWLEQAGIAWAVASGFNAPPVADYVTSVLAILQNEKLLSATPRAAVIGVGHVGHLVAERLKILNFDVILCDPLRAEQDPTFLATPMEEIVDCDLITLHVPLTHHQPYPTHHFLDKAFLERQKPHCVLLNASRGAVLNANDVKNIAHRLWCFDVWENEPWIDKEILTKTFVATPHIAGYSLQSKYRGIDMIYQAGRAKGFFSSAAAAGVAPSQMLSFAGKKCTWQEVVLTVFNPLMLTDKMKTILLATDDYGSLFDKLRNGFHHGHEFSAITLQDVRLAEEDKRILVEFGFSLTNHP
jgi:erythronate-4-phosphate dehydrogenase